MAQQSTLKFFWMNTFISTKALTLTDISCLKTIQDECVHSGKFECWAIRYECWVFNVRPASVITSCFYERTRIWVLKKVGYWKTDKTDMIYKWSKSLSSLHVHKSRKLVDGKLHRVKESYWSIVVFGICDASVLVERKKTLDAVTDVAPMPLSPTRSSINRRRNLRRDIEIFVDFVYKTWAFIPEISNMFTQTARGQRREAEWQEWSRDIWSKTSTPTLFL